MAEFLRHYRVRYTSKTDAARKAGLPWSRVKDWLKRGRKNRCPQCAEFAATVDDLWETLHERYQPAWWTKRR